MHQLMAATLDAVVAEIRAIQAAARKGAVERPRWPMIVFASPKGWTGPKEVDGKKTEGSWRSHQVPMGEMHDNPEHVRPARAVDEELPAGGAVRRRTGVCSPELAELAPQGERRMGANPHANGGLLLKDLALPDFREYAVEVSSPGAVDAEATRVMGAFLRDVMKDNLPRTQLPPLQP